MSEYEDSYYGANTKGRNLSNEMSFWLTLYNDTENNPHFLRTEHLKNLMTNWDRENEPDGCSWCFNDSCRILKYTYDDLGDLKLLDQKLFKYYYRKIRDYRKTNKVLLCDRNAGGVFDENDELYNDLCNYFQVIV